MGTQGGTPAGTEDVVPLKHIRFHIVSNNFSKHDARALVRSGEAVPAGHAGLARPAPGGRARPLGLAKLG